MEARWQRVCVFCGSSPGRREAFRDAATALGRLLAGRGLGLVYGGGGVGLMGTLADAALAAGGEVTGVIPAGLFRREVAHRGVADMRVVPSMHARKALMAELADAFVALPGGFGTLEELFEVVTWAQLGIHRKPVGLLDVDGYWGGLLTLLETAEREGFVAPVSRRILVVAREPEDLLDRLQAHVLPDVPRWVGLEET